VGTTGELSQRQRGDRDLGREAVAGEGPQNHREGGVDQAAIGGRIQLRGVGS
jgi:hypothetical protein